MQRRCVQSHKWKELEAEGNLRVFTEEITLLILLDGAPAYVFIIIS